MADQYSQYTWDDQENLFTAIGRHMHDKLVSWECWGTWYIIHEIYGYHAFYLNDMGTLTGNERGLFSALHAQGKVSRLADVEELENPHRMSFYNIAADQIGNLSDLLTNIGVWSDGEWNASNMVCQINDTQWVWDGFNLTEESTIVESTTAESGDSWEEDNANSDSDEQE